MIERCADRRTYRRAESEACCRIGRYAQSARDGGWLVSSAGLSANFAFPDVLPASDERSRQQYRALAYGRALTDNAAVAYSCAVLYTTVGAEHRAAYLRERTDTHPRINYRAVKLGAAVNKRFSALGEDIASAAAHVFGVV